MSSENENTATAVDPSTLKSNEIARAVIGAGLHPDDFRVEFKDGTATVSGTVRTEEEKQRVLNTVRGTGGVASVTDALKVSATASGGSKTGGAGTYTVKSGDTLSGIAKHHYGDAAKSKNIFEANRNQLKDPDKIQVGQVLTLPE
ncbi:MAG TPA: LysM peptidoglycan-binding domain-containing protein [Longimicrobiales bacterium]|nr:LysM peptidoglycan-binding domain-containing protein [Longimicrobiales bacterium]